jgi:thymidylate synthase (FAD)
MNKIYVGEGKVCLIAGGGQIHTDLAARFTRIEKTLPEIIASPYNAQLVKNIVDKGHLAATEFDYFIFGVEGYSRVTEVQLVRKRLANYLIKSGRVDKKGKRSFDIVIPEGIEKFNAPCTLSDGRVINLNCDDLLSLSEQWYNAGIEAGLKEEDLRYLKPQATEFKAIIGMNAHALLDWFKIRCCMNAQAEIRDMAWKMLKICKEVAPDLFENAGPSCKVLGYCPENDFQNPLCKTITKNEAMNLLNSYKRPL